MLDSDREVAVHFDQLEASDTYREYVTRIRKNPDRYGNRQKALSDYEVPA